ncbi:MAG: transcription termination/antitermination protein NusA, partial [Elusimicrobiaceae bacterium]|nr:transcription termination/antitermination protein NusA [Elusimicrobiaceae bacterium]
MDESQSKQLMIALEQLERERNIKREDVFKTIEDSLVSALRKHIGKNAQIVARMDPETGVIRAYQVMKVVETVFTPETEIALSKAKEKIATAEVGDEISIGLSVSEFSRIAAQIAKQVLIQKIRDIERDSMFREYKPREDEILTGVVRRFSDRDIIVDLGKAEGLLPFCEQIRKERYAPNGRIRAIILKVLTQKEIMEEPQYKRYCSAIMKMDRGQKGPYVILSRAADEFLAKLFEMEVPEVEEKLVELLSINREPGFRAKVVVRGKDSKVDPVGACVGMRGMRIRAITNELSGERVDLIPFVDDAHLMIINAMSPARVTSVRVLDAEHKRALVVVPDDQLPVAIGRDWQNIRLASRIPGWELEAKSETQVREETEKLQNEFAKVLTGVEGIGPKIAELL